MHSFIKGTEKRTTIFFVGIIAILIAATVMRATFYSDNYFMLANWREVLKNGFYTTDQLSMHNTYRASVEKWLSCAILYYLYNYTGMAGIYIVMIISGCLIAYLMYKLCFYTSENRMMSLLFTCVMYFMGIWFFTVRPQTLTTIILLIETLCLEHYARENNTKYLFIMPILSWLEMQLHSTIWPCFFLVMLPYIFDITVEGRKIRVNKKKTLRLMLCGSACFGSLFINPYGAWSVFYIFRSYNNPYMNACIGELAKPTVIEDGMFIWVLILVFALVVGNKKMPFRYWLLCLGFFFFMFTALRNEIFFATIGAFPLCYMLRDKHVTLRYNLIPCLLIIAIGVLSSDVVNTKTGHDRDYIPVLDKLASEYGVHGEDVFCDADTGSYAEYIGYHPYIDSRAEIFIKKVNGEEELYKEYYEMMVGIEYYKDFVNKYNFKYLIARKNTTPTLYNELFHDNDYKVLFTYNEFAVFAPNNIS